METFEIKRREIHRSSSTGSPSTNKSAPYIIKIAGIVLVTGAILLVSHFVLGYKDLNEKLLFLKQNRAERLVDETCYEEFCLTKDCVSIASRIVTLMNRTAEPCEDFYEYACGGYAKTVFVPIGQTDYSPAKEVQLVIFQNIRRVLESSLNPDNSSTLNKLKQIYKSCTNTGKRNRDHKNSFKSWLAELELSLSELTLRLESSGSWKTIVSKLEEYQIHTLFKSSFKGSASTPIEKIMVDCTLDLFPSEVYLEPSRENLYKLSLYRETIDGILTLLSMEDSEKEEFIEEVLQMETNIVRAIQDTGSASIYRLLEEEAVQIKEIWRPIIGEAVHNSDIQNVCKYNLAGIISALNQASPRMSARYVLWRMLIQVVQYLGDDFRNLQLYYTGYVPFWNHFHEKNWQACTDFIRQDLGLASYKFLEDYGFIQQQEEIKNVFSKLKSEISQTTRSNQRLSRLAKKFFQNKVKTMKIDLGYQEIVRNISVLDTVYANLQTSDDYFSNVMNVKKFKTRYFFNRIWYSNSENPLSEISLEESPLGVSFKYDYKTNKVRLDSTTFQFPLSLYFGDIPKYLKFGETSMLARVMAHAFDTTGKNSFAKMLEFLAKFHKLLGSLYGGNGIKWDKAFLPQNLREEHDNFTECLMSQLSSSAYWFAEINNTDYIDTIVADMGSFLVPYESLKKYLINETEVMSLPAINLDQKQLFYVQVTQKYCEVRASPIYSEEKTGLSKRSRVNIAVSNMKDFASVFSCNPQHSLDLEYKCI